MKLYSRFAALLGIMLIFTGVTTASAHERQEFIIGNKSYTITVGSLNEPTVVDDKTGVDLRVVKGTSPEVGLDQTLKVELIAGEAKKTLPLSAVYGTPGSYKAGFYPTIPTTYSYRFFGTINDTPVDITFSCNPAGHAKREDDKSPTPMGEGVIRTLKSGAFGCPIDKEELGFPEKTTSLTKLISATSEAAKSDTGGIALILAIVALIVATGAYRR